MIIFRYLTRQILQVMAAVTVILLIVGLINRFIQYLGQAVAGELASDVLLLFIFYRLPDFLLVILPLALFLGILLVYGRMYAENEMTVLIGSGLSNRQLLGVSLASAAAIILLVAALSFEIAPWGIRNTELLEQQQKELTELDLMVAGQFQAFGDGSRVTYAERINNAETARRLENVFVVSTAADQNGDTGIRLIISETARSQVDAASGNRYMRLENVRQYEGRPGRADFAVAQFDTQSILLPEPEPFQDIQEEMALPTLALLGSEEPAYMAELQWRISAVLLIPIITLIAVPLSKVNPRQGRYSKLVPAALLYAMYFILLQICRDRIADGSLPPLIGMWWVHGLFLALAAAVYSGRRLPGLTRGRA
ncbi:MAG: hypothetical protein RLZZ385_1773 [Pseudomonadota bacterium]